MNNAPKGFELKLYAIKSKDGKWFKSRGQGGIGPRWVDGIDQAKIYSKPGPAKGVITYWGSNYPGFDTPDLVEITAKEFEVIDQTDRVNKVKEDREAKRLIAEAKNKQRKLERAQEEADRANKKLEELKRKQNV